MQCTDDGDCIATHAAWYAALAANADREFCDHGIRAEGVRPAS